MEGREYQLKHPIKEGTQVITMLTFRRPKAKDMRKMPVNATQDDLINLAGSLCGFTPITMDQIDIDDYLPIMEIVGSFLDPGLATGETL